MPSKIHNAFRPLAVLPVIAFACLFAASEASALTAKELTDKMPKEQRSSYLVGMVEMLQAQASIAGEKKKSQCIFDAYFRDGAHDGDAWSKLIAALDQFPDRQATDIVYLITKKTCGG